MTHLSPTVNAWVIAPDIMFWMVIHCFRIFLKMVFIHLNQVSKTYGSETVALKPTSLTIDPGTFTVILGPSGAGKSTLLRMINGLETPTTGEVVVQGQRLSSRNLRRVRSRTAMIFQQFNLVGRLNVMTNVLTGRCYYRPWWTSALYLFNRQDMERAHWALSRVGLTEKAWERTDQLSGGQQQRVAIARALCQEPTVILADEPVASLDPISSEEVMGLLREICQQDGITIVANLHQVDLAMRYADRIVGLNKGEIVFDGGPTELAQNERTLNTIYQREDIHGGEGLEVATAY
nr:phosphonate ABC transporter ATP-binding protein [Pleurocapsa sp. PCC 7327]